MKVIKNITNKSTGWFSWWRNSENISPWQVPTTLGFVQTKQEAKKLLGVAFNMFSPPSPPSPSIHIQFASPRQRVYRKLASTKTWWAYKSPAADRGRCLASRVGGDQDLITLCHRALGWKTQASARAKMASGLREQASHCEYNPKHSNGETEEDGPFKTSNKISFFLQLGSRFTWPLFIFFLSLCSADSNNKKFCYFTEHDVLLPKACLPYVATSICNIKFLVCLLIVHLFFGET